jgi:hypothetical protein
MFEYVDVNVEFLVPMNFDYHLNVTNVEEDNYLDDEKEGEDMVDMDYMLNGHLYTVAVEVYDKYSGVE